MKCEKFLQKLIEKTMLEKYYISKQHNNGYCIELEYWSDLGEDVIISLVTDKLTKQKIIDELYNYKEGFDAEEKATMWYNLNGKHNAPTSLRDLLNDADKQADNLEKIYNIACSL